jgi:hypothetical protein
MPKGNRTSSWDSPARVNRFWADGVKDHWWLISTTLSGLWG